jgi:hypothetical protein
VRGRRQTGACRQDLSLDYDSEVVSDVRTALKILSVLLVGGIAGAELGRPPLSCWRFPCLSHGAAALLPSDGDLVADEVRRGHDYTRGARVIALVQR